MNFVWRQGGNFTAHHWIGIWVMCNPNDSLETYAPYVVQHRRDGKFYLSPRAMCPPSKERGPFDTLEDAKVAAEIVLLLDEVPEGWQ